MPRRVRVGSLVFDDVFRTALTRRIGVVLGPKEGNGIPVYLEPLAGDLFEEKTLAPEIVVEIDGSPEVSALAILPSAA